MITRLLLGLLLPGLWLASCTLEEDILRAPGTVVEFSLDTLRFDTVFTEVGSATRSLKIYNRNSRPLSLNSVAVVNSNGGRFRINVDGISGEEVRDVFIPAEDSIFVFVEVTVDPDADLSVSPYVLEAFLRVRAIDVDQFVLLEAWGQNANYLPRNRNRESFGFLSCDLGTITWDDPKPYVIYGSLIVDSCTLVLPEGTRIYLHGGLVSDEDLGLYNAGLLIFQSRGRLQINGTAERPVLIASDRLEPRFIERPGQYSGIRLNRRSGPHSIRFAEIRNGIVGVFADSASVLDIQNTSISYTASNGIVAYAAQINAQNLLIHSAGAEPFAAINGGRYSLDYCTFTNYTGRSSSLYLSNGFVQNNQILARHPLQATLRNSIFFGSSADAIALLDISQNGANTAFNYQFDHCILRLDNLLQRFPDFSDRCNSCLSPAFRDPLFLNASRDSFQLDSMSVAIEAANPIPGIDIDLPGRLRDTERPDIGAYEFFPN